MKGRLLETVIEGLTDEVHAPELKQRIADGVTYIAKSPAATVSKPTFNMFLIPCFAKIVYQGKYLDVPAEEFVDEMIGVFEASVKETYDPKWGRTVRMDGPYKVPEWLMNEDREAAVLKAFTTYFLDHYDTINRRLEFA